MINSDWKYRVFSLIHRSTKKILHKPLLSGQSIINFKNYNFGIDDKEAPRSWENFVLESKIKTNSQFKDFHYAGFLLEDNEWIHASWIWTNAAIVRLYVSCGHVENAERLGKHLASKQDKCGGWIVRNDYDKRGAIPILAPNDSAYVANNAFLSLYSATGNKLYLKTAEKCAKWIISTCRNDGLVYTGYNLRDSVWDTNNIIVDTGFTAGLFARLYDITKKEEYKDFLKRFVYKYIDLFYNIKFKGFATSIDKFDKQQGGFFGRGQAWALEGLIPAYTILRDPMIKDIIEATIKKLIRLQNPDGGWAYNLSRKMLGEDCKGVSVIAKSLAEWYTITHDSTLIESIEKALTWCKRHTKTNGTAQGGIFSFCVEGGIVKNLYSSCAFVYASTYAIEVEHFLKKAKQ